MCPMQCLIKSLISWYLKDKPMTTRLKTGLTAYSTFIFFVLVFTTISAKGQTDKSLRVAVGLSRVFISTGYYIDVGGFALSANANRFVSKHFNVEIEYKFAHGRSVPRRFSQIFSEKTVHYFEAVIAGYPFSALRSRPQRNIFDGFNLTTGPSIFFGTVTGEDQWTSLYDSSGNEISRRSTLGFSNHFEESVLRRAYCARHIYPRRWIQLSEEC
jgi:hypothetical protein